MKEPIRIEHNKRRFYSSWIDYLSFSQEVRALVDVLNTEIAAPDKVVFRPISHPAGFVRLLTKRRLTIAEAYIKLITHTQSASYAERIEALQVLVHHIWHSKNLSMPINTARVQIALMKNAVKMRGNRRAQLELMSDFARASYGQASVIRRLLRELDLIEVPETGADLSQMDLGWDNHVHDSMTEGRKSPTQLVLDAFIKGMSRITVAYYDVAERQLYEEVFLAGRILGIRVQVGIEFSVGKKYARVHYLYVPKQGVEFAALSTFLDEKEQTLAPFWNGLKENAARRHRTVTELLDTFNHTGLPKFNEPFADLAVLQMAPLSWESVEAMAGKGQANRIHLGQLIYQSMRPVALKRVLYLKNQYRALEQHASHDASASWEADRCYTRYEHALDEYEALTPALCAEKYIAPQKQVDYDSVFESESDILPLLKKCGGYIVFIHPLSHGLQRCIDIFFEQYRNITDIEVFNLVDAISRDPIEIRRFASFLLAIRAGDAKQIETMLSEWRLPSHPRPEIDDMIAYLRENPHYMRCASDAVGWSSNIPGMGFIAEPALTPQSLKLFKNHNHAILPQPVSDLILAQRKYGNSAKKAVYLMSSAQMNDVPPIQAAHSSDRITPTRFWRYVNVNIRCLILATLGFFPTIYFLGLWYAVLWFAITAFRNIIVDLIAASGLLPQDWQLKNIDRENTCASLFFSGVSVPVLLAAKEGFDLAWFGLGLAEGFWFTFTKFWCIAFANGIYLVLHNTLRGFDKAAIRGNFFRSVLSWPLATLGSYILTPLGVPDVVQSKIWSEVVAGFIEGAVKTIKQKRLARKAVLEVYRQLESQNPIYAQIARLDILFFWSQYTQGRRTLKKFLAIQKHPIRSLSDEDTAQIARCNTLIVSAFTTEGSLESMTYIILEYYPEENLSILTDFIGEFHTPFVEWLNRRIARS
ncbi:MAG: hypothetical protein IJU23_11285 [Proteobacteria bacterium]|nr:hypothetical protein [Pseudomonadota bacterium]